MKAKCLAVFTSVLVVKSLTFAPLSLAQEEFMNAMIDQQLNSGEFKEPAKCLGVSEKKIADSTKSVFSTCVKSVGMTEDDALDNCVKTAMPKALGVAKGKFESCAQKFEEEDEADMAADSFDPKEIEALAAGLENTLQAAASGSEGKITLPVYPGSKIQSHFEDGMKFGEVQTPPGAMFSSSDSVQQIVAFYKKSLKGYDYKDMGKFGHLFMKNMPANFDFMKDMNLYLSTPHVLVTGFGGAGGPRGAKSKIEIAYEK